MDMFDQIVRHMAINTDLGAQTVREEMEYRPDKAVIVAPWMKSYRSAKHGHNAGPELFDSSSGVYVNGNLRNALSPDGESDQAMIVPDWAASKSLRSL